MPTHPDPTPDDTPTPARSVYYSFSTFDYDGTPAQQTLHANGLAADVLNFPLHGGGETTLHGRWLLDRGGAGGGQSATRKGRRVESSGGQGFYSVGYSVTLLGVLRFYPLLGVGGWGLGAQSESPAPDTEKLTLLQTSGPLLQLGFGAELLVGVRRGLRLGVRLGWQWTLSGQRARIPFMRLVFGWGRLR